MEQPDKQSKKRGPWVTEVNGYSFVSGLLWQALRRQKYMREAREFGKKTGMDIVSVRKSRDRRQGGFVTKALGVNKGMYSLAAAVAGQLGDTFLAAFELPDGRFALVAAHNGSIIPGSDKIYTSIEELEIDVRRYGGAHKYTDDQIYSPREIGYGGTVLDISELLTAPRLKDKTYRLRPLEFGLSREEWIKVGIGCVFAIGIAVAGSSWLSYQDALQKERAIEAERARLAELAKLNEVAKQEQSLKALEHPWATMIAPLDFIQACNAEFSPLPLVLGGWLSESVRCVPERFEAVYNRKGAATANSLIEAAGGVFDLAPVFTDAGDRALLNSPMQMLKVGDSELLSTDYILARIYSHLQSIGIRPSIEEVPYVAPAAPLPGAAGSEVVQPVPDWRTFKLSVQTQIPPELLFPGMETQGVRIKEIQIARSDDMRITWLIDGEIYAR